jgi:hypothetical protein
MNEELNNHRVNSYKNMGKKSAISQDSMKDVHLELKKFKETKQSITDLIKYRVALLDVKDSELNHHALKEEEIKERVMEAIDNLFDEENEKAID